MVHHPGPSAARRGNWFDPVIGSGVYIGPNSVIAMGVTIGDCAVIGAMSFVKKDIPSRKKAWGCPAIVAGDVEGSS